MGSLNCDRSRKVSIVLTTPQVLESVSPAVPPRPILPVSELMGLCALVSDLVAAAVIWKSPCVVAKACPHMSAFAIGAQML
jgi:hypothetical protein